MSIADARCPRCWYELEGAIRNHDNGSWRMSIRCSECGLESSTRDCIPGYIPTPGWVFDGPGNRSLVQRWFATTARVPIPFHPWRTLTLSAEKSLLRLFIWWVSLYMLVFLLGTGLTAWATHLEPANVFANVSVLQILQIYDTSSIGWPPTRADLWRSSVIWALTAPLICFPLWFVSCGMLWLLPVTRRRCKIRTAHMIRLALYSSIPTLLFVFVYPTQSLLAGYFVSASFLMSLWLGALVLIYMPLWWLGAIRHYLKMPHAPLVVFLMMVMAVLAELVVMVGAQHGIW